MHVNFKLSKDGEKIILSDANGKVNDHMGFGSLEPDQAFGRSVDGAESWVELKPTPAAPNGGEDR